MALTLLLLLALAAEDQGTLKLEIVEKAPAGEDFRIPARVHLSGPEGKPVQAPGLPFFHDHFNCDGSVILELPPGPYSYTVERGPEYRSVMGTVDLKAGQPREETVHLKRWIDLAARGWWSGETHVHRPLEHMGLLLRAEDLHVATVLTVWNKNNLWRSRPLPETLLVQVEPARFFHVLACEDERRGGALLYHNVTRPLQFQNDGPEYPSPVKHILEAREQKPAWIEIEKPFWWDVPAWVATGKIDSIGIANNHMCRSRMLENEAWGKPRDTGRLPPPRGNGFFTQEIYYHFLNCGFRIPPTAGSASGVLPNPLGYNRVYVHLDEPFTYEGWWKGLAAGRSFVTNGPVLLVEANGRLPGEVFRNPRGNLLRISLDIRVDGNDPLEAVEIIRDGKAMLSLQPESRTGEGQGDLRGWHHPAPFIFEKSGWFLVRAIARVPGTFRFASTAPFYVEIGGKKAIHRADVEYFLRWIGERIDALRESRHLSDPVEREAVLQPHLEARRVFEKLLGRAE